MLLTLNIEFISLVRNAFFKNISLMIHSCENIKKSCLTCEIYFIFNVKPLNILYILNFFKYCLLQFAQHLSICKFEYVAHSKT